MEKIKIYFGNLLGINLNDSNHPIVQEINSIDNASNQEQEIKKHQLRTLGVNLFDIKKYDEIIFDYYLSRIKNNNDISIYGHIAEIKQCAHFISKALENQLDFRFGDPNKNEPDFLINEHGIEIGSARFSLDNKNPNPAKKLIRSFKKKNNNNYTNLNCALIIDISEISNSRNVDYSKFPKFEEIKNEINLSNDFGVIMYFVEKIVFVDNEIVTEGKIYPEFNNDCNEELKELMKSIFLK